MVQARVPTASEVLELMDQLQRSETGRTQLHSGWEIYRAAVDAGMIAAGGIDRLARCMQELCDEQLIAYQAVSAGSPPLPAVWDGSTIQQLHDWRVTAAGRRDALLYRETPISGDRAAAEVESPRRDTSRGPAPSPEGHDLFISHAGEDKEAIARPLAVVLRRRGYRVWFDEFELRMGMSLRRSIDKGLAGSRFGVVILSPAFFGKEWPERELDGLAARETADGRHLILPVWHQVGKAEVAAYSPVLADRVAARSNDGVDAAADAIVKAVGPPAHGDRSATTAELPNVGLTAMPTAVRLSPVLLGSQLLRLLDGTYEAVFELDRLPAGPSRRRTAELFDDLRDRGDIIGDLGMVERDRWEEELSQAIVELLDAGVVLLGGGYTRRLKSPGGDQPWPGYVLKAIPLEEAQRKSNSEATQMSGEDATAIALAQVLIDKGDLDGAAVRLSSVAECGNGHALLLLGMVLRDLERIDEAAAMLQRAADAGRTEALAPLGMVLRDLGRLDEAEEVLTRAVQLNDQPS